MKVKRPFFDLNEAYKAFPLLYGESTKEQEKRYNNAFEIFKNYFDCNCAFVASSSGRVEVCGNHTDHNGGRVVSCAISLDILAMFMPREDGVVHIKTEGYQYIVLDINCEATEELGTSEALVRGVIVALQNNSYNVGGFNAYFTSNVVGGAGISSSAAFEVLIAEIENFLFNDGKITAEEKAVFSQYAENVYFGKPCGLLDQTAIAFGGLKKLDFSSKDKKIKVENIDCNLNDYSFVLINTGGSHADLTDEYASIPAEMFSVAKAMGKERLIEIDEEEFYSLLPKVFDKVSDRAILRAVHFFEENKRVDLLVDSLNNGNYNEFLKCIKESGLSSLSRLQNCFVSGSGVQLIPKALAIADKFLDGGVNRVHGGGFAGTILNIVKNDKVQDFVKEMSRFFDQENIIPLRVRSVGAIVL